MAGLKDLTGQSFGRLFVMGRNLTIPSGISRWDCYCACGGTTTVVGYSLLSGHTQSCGCIAIEILRMRSTTHGMSHAPEWQAWAGMKQRCINPADEKYPIYGGRGIRVCDQWFNSFENFYRDMGPRPSSIHSLDRIEVNGHYEPGNCRWATPKEQADNTRSTILVEIGGVVRCFDDWIDFLGLNRSTIHYRKAKGMTPYEALTTPIRNYDQVRLF